MELWVCVVRVSLPVMRYGTCFYAIYRLAPEAGSRFLLCCQAVENALKVIGAVEVGYGVDRSGRMGFSRCASLVDRHASEIENFHQGIDVTIEHGASPLWPTSRTEFDEPDTGECLCLEYPLEGRANLFGSFPAEFKAIRRDRKNGQK